MTPVEQLKSVLCDPEGKCCIAGSDEDRAIIDRALQALAQPEQKPVAWKWHQAPVKTLWGHDMVVADLAIDKDNTVSVYCERDQTAKVEAMFTTPPAAQRTWVGLTDEEIIKTFETSGHKVTIRPQDVFAVISMARAIEAHVKEKNA